MSFEQQQEVVSPTSIQKNQEVTFVSRRSEKPIFNRQKCWKNHATTDAYEDSPVMDARLFKNKLFTMKNTHTSNAALFKILGCIDPDDWHELLPETTLAAAPSAAVPSQDFEVDDGPWSFYKFQAKSASAGNPATLTFFMSEGQ